MQRSCMVSGPMCTAHLHLTTCHGVFRINYFVIFLLNQASRCLILSHLVYLGNFVFFVGTLFAPFHFPCRYIYKAPCVWPAGFSCTSPHCACPSVLPPPWSESLGRSKLRENGLEAQSHLCKGISES